jgi:hypothetical protein
MSPAEGKITQGLRKRRSKTENSMWKQTRKYFDSFNTPGSKPEEKK